MKGKSCFTQNEINQLRLLIKNKRITIIDAKKNLKDVID